MNNFKNKKNSKLFIVGIIMLFILSIGGTYAYFSVNVEGNTEATDIIASTADLKLIYTDGPEVKGEFIYPGWRGTKSFTVENTGSLPTTYSISLLNVTNTIENNELIMSYTSDGGAFILNYPVGVGDTVLSQNVMIAPGDTHTYNLIVEFIETGSNQNYNQNKEFYGMINIISGNDTNLIQYLEMEKSMIAAAKTYVQEEIIVDSTYIPVKELNLDVDENVYVTSSTGVEVFFEDSNVDYRPIITTYTGKNSYALMSRNTSSNVVLLGANPYTMSDSFVEPGYIVSDDYMVVAKDTQLLSNGKNTLTYNIYKDNELIDTLSRVVYKDDNYSDNIITCEGEIKNNVTTLTVSATNDIDSYDVYSNNSLVGNGTTNTYTINRETSNVYINIKDQLNNSLQKMCYITNYDLPLEVHMIDVGSGGEDSILVRNDKATMQIDGGAYGHGDEDTLEYLSILGITDIDLLLGSHTDYNHIQAHGALLSNHNVKNVLYNSNIRSCIDDDYCIQDDVDYVLPEIENRGIVPTILENGDELYYNGFRIKVIAPKEFVTLSENNNATNMNSLNFILTHKNKKFLFTGDYIAEEHILSEYSPSELNIDFLKHPHHGGISLSTSFIEILDPEIDFISDGLDTLGENYPGVKTALENIGTQIYQTLHSNSILAVSDGNTISVEENVYPSIYNRTIEHNTTQLSAQSFINNYNTLGLSMFTHEPTVSQNYQTTEYRYQGSNPNNYILFNNNQLWRIIGLFEVEDGTGSASKAYRFKLISNNKYVESFDTNGLNYYPSSSLNTLLNSGDYYNRTNDYNNNGLTSQAKSQISPTLWYLAGYSSSSKTAEELYEYERSDGIYGGNSVTYLTTLGIIYASDYAYGSNICYTLDSNEDNIGNNACSSTNWLYDDSYEYTMTPFTNSNNYLFSRRTSGHLSYDLTDGENSFIRPVVYLKPNTTLSGSGTPSDPFIIH